LLYEFAWSLVSDINACFIQVLVNLFVVFKASDILLDGGITALVTNIRA
jgi:hypothetical protein